MEHMRNVMHFLAVHLIRLIRNIHTHIHTSTPSLIPAHAVRVPLWNMAVSGPSRRLTRDVLSHTSHTCTHPHAHTPRAINLQERQIGAAIGSPLTERAASIREIVTLCPE